LPRGEDPRFRCPRLGLIRLDRACYG
jgi:hypothetical protein